MFAVIGKKIFDKLGSSTDFNAANNALGSELVVNGDFATDSDWDKTGGATTSGGFGYLAKTPTSTLTQTSIFTVGKTYSYTLLAKSEDGGGQLNISNGVATHVNLESVPTTYTTYSGSFTADGTSLIFSESATGNISIDNVSVKEFNNKVFPVIIPQGANYPCTTFEIMNVSNFLSKGNSLNSCDVSIRIIAFADDYNTTYNQAKAVVEALDLYSVTYTEDSVDYTAKFRFETLDDNYFKSAEKFYKEIIFNCLIIKN